MKVYSYELSSLVAAGFQSATANAYFRFDKAIEEPTLNYRFKNPVGHGNVVVHFSTSFDDPADTSITPVWSHQAMFNVLSIGELAQQCFAPASLVHQGCMPYGRLQFTMRNTTSGQASLEELKLRLAARE